MNKQQIKTVLNALQKAQTMYHGIKNAQKPVSLPGFQWDAFDKANEKFEEAEQIVLDLIK